MSSNSASSAASATHVARSDERRPGITGLWQVRGRNDANYRRRVKLDAYYARHRSLWLDLRILLATARVVLSGAGAY